LELSIEKYDLDEEIDRTGGEGGTCEFWFKITEVKVKEKELLI